MTRANLNFVWQNWGESPKTLYFYWNGDQYPSGLRDFYGIKEWLADPKAFNSSGFSSWIEKNYKENGKAYKPRLVSHPAVYYDNAGFPTDYSYVFAADCIYKRLPQTDEEKVKNIHRGRWLNGVRVYEWDKLIFKGTVENFLKWLEKRPKYR